MTLNFEHVDRIEIQKDKEHIVIKRDVDGWRLESPLKDLADNQVADSFVKDIYPERILEVANEESSIDWTKYGLNPPAATISLTDSAGAQNVFHISNKKNFESNIFARKGDDNRVIVITPAWENRIQKTAMDFRDRRVLRKSIATVDELTLKNEKGSFSIRRKDGRWQVVDGKELDQNKVRKFLTTLSEAKADQILEDQKIAKGQKSLFRLDLKMDGEISPSLLTLTMENPPWPTVFYLRPELFQIARKKISS